MYCPTVTPIVSEGLVYPWYGPTVTLTVGEVLVYLRYCPTVTPILSEVLVYMRYSPTVIFTVRKVLVCVGLPAVFSNSHTHSKSSGGLPVVRYCPTAPL